jgi:hypothetical protein
MVAMLLASHWIEKKKLEGLADGNYRVEIYNYFFRVWMAWSRHAGMLRELRKAREITSTENSSNIPKCLDKAIQTRKP